LFKIPTKICSCCGIEKPISEFYREAYTDLVANQCKVCIGVKRKVDRAKARHGKFVSTERRRAMDWELEYPLADWKAAMLHFGGACAYCGTVEGRAKDKKMDRDHLKPMSKGGKTEKHNIVPACKACNRGRGNKDWIEWFRKQPFYTVEREERIKRWEEAK